MKKQKMFEAVSGIRDDIVEKAENYVFVKKVNYRKRWSAVIAAMLAITIGLGVIFWPKSNSVLLDAYAIAKAEYPEVITFPSKDDYNDYDKYKDEYSAWYSQNAELRKEYTVEHSRMNPFLTRSISQILSNTNGENRVYSPLNVYMALAMAAEITDGSSRQQILDLLGESSIETLRQQACALWNLNYKNDGATTTVLAGSLWLNENTPFKQSVLDTLARTYYASSYKGQMGSDNFNTAFRQWLNEQTGGLLEEQISGLKLEPETVLAVATTVYFKAAWASEFKETNTSSSVFHAPFGDMTCRFLNESKVGNYYWGENFSAVQKNFKNGGSMIFILPEEGSDTDTLLTDTETLSFLAATDAERQNGNYRNSLINLSVPKFDIDSNLDLTENLRSLGITDIFDSVVSDFSPLTDTQLYVDKMEHSARVVINEQGCTAAAYTVMTANGASFTTDKVDFVLDRPFIFAITGNDGLPLFVGIVNSPV